jgi:hypothetical protein
VKIIELESSKKRVWQESDFWKGLLAEGISISFLSSPSALEAKKPNPAGCHHIMQSEVKHVFNEQFRPKVLAEPVTGAIIISHLRALMKLCVSSTRETESSTFLKATQQLAKTLWCCLLTSWPTYWATHISKTPYTPLSRFQNGMSGTRAMCIELPMTSSRKAKQGHIFKCVPFQFKVIKAGSINS